MSDADRFQALDDGPEVELRVKGSRFLGRALRADDEAQATGRLTAVRRRYHDATHHCWAIRIGGPERTLERGDDDGEPTGTAGRPILDTLRGRAVHDALLVVTRYYGGTKLGPGGLARAYGQAAAQAVAAAPSRSVTLTARLEAACAYDDLGLLEAVLARHGAELLEVERDYSGEPCFRLTLPRSRAGWLLELLVEASAGRAILRRLDDGRSG